MDQELIQHAPGLGGALVAAVSKFKEGWRVVVSQFTMGAIPVVVLGAAIEWGAGKLGVPRELVGFAVGWLGVATCMKGIETIQRLEIAQPINELIERWTGAKAPPAQVPAAQPTQEVQP